MVSISSLGYFRPLLLTTGVNLMFLKTLRNAVFKYTLLIRIHLGKELRTSATIDCSADMFLRSLHWELYRWTDYVVCKWNEWYAQATTLLFNADGTLWWVLGSGVFSYQSACSLIYYFKCSTWNCNLRFKFNT